MVSPLSHERTGVKSYEEAGCNSVTWGPEESAGSHFRVMKLERDTQP